VAGTASDSIVGMPAFGGGSGSGSGSSAAVAVAAPPAIALPPDLSLEEAERRYARAILERCDNNQSAAARALGISRNKLARLLRG
jgi:Nif-specific regulatory protein